ncbi:hypothetical protein G4B88_024780 [Cannabis sativa]|uniref:MADS-box domain-containing protein n=1 Tax=Cannabis sativa TaxID=3483 RepID=A0A7J6E350_CANSA|nr:hypothetical protein G4B88_024780 [Cannabis sativa]
MTRKKVNMQYITDDSSRKNTFRKRKNGILKKVEELSTLCGVDACAIIYDPNSGEPTVFPSTEKAHHVVTNFLAMSKIDQTKKMFNQEEYLRNRIETAKEQVRKLKRDNREKELIQIMYSNLEGNTNLQDLSVEDLNDLTRLIDQSIEEINKRIGEININIKPSQMPETTATTTPLTTPIIAENLMERSNKMVNQEAFLRKKIKEMNEQLIKLRKENREELTQLLYSNLSGKANLHNLSAKDLNDLIDIIDKSLEGVKKRIKTIAAKNDDTSLATQMAIATKAEGSAMNENFNNEDGKANAHYKLTKIMTRKKVKLAYINNDASRKATYKKRKKGLLKKVSELSTLCGVDACAIIYSPYDTQPEVYPSPGGVHRIVKKFKKMPEIEQGKKMMNQEVFLKQKIGKVSEQMKRLKKENRDRELNRLLYGNLSGKMNLQGLTVTDLNDLTSLIDQNLKDINKRMEELAKETKTARMAAAAAAKVPPLMNREVNSTSATTSTAYNNNRGGGMQRRQDLNTQNQANNNNAMKVNRILTRFNKILKMEQNNKMVNQEAFLRKRIKEVSEQVKKLRKENREKELTQLMYSYLSGKANLVGLSVTDLNDLVCIIDKNLEEINKRIETIAAKNNSTNSMTQMVVAAKTEASATNENFNDEVKLAYINNDASRKATYKKRKKGLIKKVSELSTLCGVDVCAIIYSPYNTQPEVYPSPRGVHRIVKNFKTMPEIEQSKKMMNQEVFLKQKIGKVSEQMKRLKKENRDKELNRLLYGNLSGKMNLQGLTVTDLNDLTSLIDLNLKDINKRMEEIAKETKNARTAASAAAKVPPLMNRECIRMIVPEA